MTKRDIRVNGPTLFQVMREITERHADHLARLEPVQVLALDPCPRCMGRVVAGDSVARCRNCGWRYSADQPEPLASRRADP